MRQPQHEILLAITARFVTKNINPPPPLARSFHPNFDLAILLLLFRHLHLYPLSLHSYTASAPSPRYTPLSSASLSTSRIERAIPQAPKDYSCNATHSRNSQSRICNAYNLRLRLRTRRIASHCIRILHRSTHRKHAYTHTRIRSSSILDSRFPIPLAVQLYHHLSLPTSNFIPLHQLIRPVQPHTY